MASTQACPNCQRAHDVAVYVTGQKILCTGCGIRFEVKRTGASGTGSGSGVNATLNLRPARTPLGVPAVQKPGANEVAPNELLPNAAGLDVTFRPVTRPSGNHRAMPLEVGVPAPIAANGAAPGPGAGPVPAETADGKAAAFQPRIVIPGYELTLLLGRGGMGEVWKAKQTSLGRTVAVKLLPEELAKDREFVARFEKEATALASLSHPHIIQIIDRGEAEGIYYFVMEFVDGKSLREWITTKKPTAQETVRLVTQIFRAMEAAHDGGIIHRDLKPENILVDGRGHAKVADFGLAGMRQGEERLQLTGTAVAMGTINYMAPEQRRDARNVDHRADLYSMGVILYELLTGDLPVGRFRMPSEKVPGTDKRIDDIVGRLLETEPKDRFASATEVLAALEPLQSSTQVSGIVVPSANSTPGGGTGTTGTYPSVSAVGAPKSIVEKGFKGLRNGLVVIGALAVIGFGVRMIFGRNAPQVTISAGDKQLTLGANGATGETGAAAQKPSATGNSEAELFSAATVTPLDGQRQRLELSMAPGDEEMNVHSGEWKLEDGILTAVQVGNEVEAGEKVVPRMYLAKRYFSADDFDAQVEVEYHDVRDRYALPEDGIQQFAELAFRIKNVQVSVYAIPGTDARLLWHYTTPDGVELADNSSRAVEQGLDDVTPAPKDGTKFKLRLSLRKAKDGVEARAFLNGNLISRKILPGLQGQVGKLALGCRNYECRFDALSVEGKPAAKPAPRKVAGQND